MKLFDKFSNKDSNFGEESVRILASLNFVLEVKIE